MTVWDVQFEAMVCANHAKYGHAPIQRLSTTLQAVPVPASNSSLVRRVAVRFHQIPSVFNHK